MPRDPRYDILFEPIRIGPVTARNRFYQVPHCNGLARLHPQAAAGMRRVKAAGGWAVINTEEVELHHSSDVSPYIEGRLWDDRDIPAFEASVEAIHAEGALAGIELAHNGFHAPNRYSREVPLAPSHMMVGALDPVQAKAMDKQDIANVRRWHRNAALRAKRAGFDIVYCYAGHDLTLPMHFISRRYNHRSDEYGGSLENRVRLYREIIEDTKDAVGDRCAVAVRFAVDEVMGEGGLCSETEGREVVEMLAELPDLWDVNVSDWSNDSVTARFGEEGGQERYVAFVKSVTSKPVVGVGRFTSADAMVSQIKRGILHLIGAARPSIADPFLPKKIEEGRLEDIRECIGCNICVAGDMVIAPIRCTQNPTKGEEWRKDWHPEEIAPAKSPEAQVLVVGAGPAGLECALSAARRGYSVVLAEAGQALGGIAARMARLPGLASYGRVRDYREGQLRRMANAEIYLDSPLSVHEVLDFGARFVVIATGAFWRLDGVGRQHPRPLAALAQVNLLVPDDFLDGTVKVEAVQGRNVVIYDDDHYLLGGVIAEALVGMGAKVTLVTPAADVSSWTHNTLEQARIQTRLLELGVTIRSHRAIVDASENSLGLACVFTGRIEYIACDWLVPLTSREPSDALFRMLKEREGDWADVGIAQVSLIGDALAPATVAHAVYSGHRLARELEEEVDPDVVPFRRELPGIAGS